MLLQNVALDIIASEAQSHSCEKLKTGSKNGDTPATVALAYCLLVGC